MWHEVLLEIKISVQREAEINLAERDKDPIYGLVT